LPAIGRNKYNNDAYKGGQNQEQDPGWNRKGDFIKAGKRQNGLQNYPAHYNSQCSARSVGRPVKHPDGKPGSADE